MGKIKITYIDIKLFSERYDCSFYEGLELLKDYYNIKEPLYLKFE